MQAFLKKPWVMWASLLLVLLVGWLLMRQFYPRARILPRLTDIKQGVISFNSPKEVNINQPFTMRVEMNTQGEVVNAIGMYFYYEPDKLRLLDMDTTGSFCQFYPEKKFDNNIGKLSLACGSPHPGVKGTNTILVLKFMPLSVGTTTIRTDRASKILRSDGKGTNILLDYPTDTIHIQVSI